MTGLADSFFLHFFLSFSLWKESQSKMQEQKFHYLLGVFFSLFRVVGKKHHEEKKSGRKNERGKKREREREIANSWSLSLVNVALLALLDLLFFLPLYLFFLSFSLFIRLPVRCVCVSLSLPSSDYKPIKFALTQELPHTATGLDSE